MQSKVFSLNVILKKLIRVYNASPNFMQTSGFFSFCRVSLLGRQIILGTHTCGSACGCEMKAAENGPVQQQHLVVKLAR